MAQVELIMPKMGESIMEATILEWLKQEGDTVEADENVLLIATDKVDSEVPSPVSGTISKIFFQENDTVEIGKVIALIATEGEEAEPSASPAQASTESRSQEAETASTSSPEPVQEEVASPEPVGMPIAKSGSGNRFYSPLVRNIAQKENVSYSELEQLPGSGMHGRVTKKDILSYVEQRKQGGQTINPAPTKVEKSIAPASSPAVSLNGDVEIVEMDRMRKLIADHMVMSKHTSPHVTSFVEVDVTDIVNWRNSIKQDFQAKYKEKITYTPIFVEAVVKAINDFPMINVSVNDNQIIVKKNINIGMATALPSGNLIVPVIKNADQLNLLGLTKSVNDLAKRARENKLKPQEIQDGTFTLTNVGTFGNVMGTPIINQPQVAIMATGAIRKKPAVVETEYGDLIAVRHMMFLSMSYDHRVVDGILGGSFLRRVGDYLESFDKNRTI
jgi:2-oxoglutarate dehydrogenase E2 component (dihydrolipoamide succinyltransferase)